jgi:transcriptional regulator with XRE-family HTH domain
MEILMQRPSVYLYKITEPPGVNVHRLREAKGLSMRELAQKCRPPLNHTTIRRIEQNKGFTKDSLERVAKTLGVRVIDLFCPKNWQASEELRRMRGKVKFSVSLKALREDR